MKRLYFILFFFLMIIASRGQVGINNDSTQSDPSAMLDVKSATKGFLPPRIALVAANMPDPVTSPATGLFVFNTSTSGTPPNNVVPGYYWWNGTRWIGVTIPDGINPGDMLYWNGSSWVIVPVGLNGQILTLINGVPTWGGALLPVIYTTPATGITAFTASGGGFISSDGGSPVTERGICWSTSPAPTTANNKSAAGTGPGSFTTIMTALLPATTYYVRAYAINSQGTAYGNEITLTTLTGQATLTTNSISSIMAFTATGGGYISNDGGATITSRGVCWSLTSGPTTADSKTANGTGTGSFTSYLTGLTTNSVYYVRAYAINGAGTFYGNEVTFTTQSGVVSLTTASVTSIMAQTATGGGTITLDGGSTVTSRGICWSTVTGPTTADSKTINGSGTGSFTGSMTGLAANTLYFVRAYAINGAGTYYGNEVSFTTMNGIILLTTTAGSNILYNTATSGGTITSDGGSSVTLRGVCWNTVPNPTIVNSKTTDGSGTGTFISSMTGLSLNTTYYVRAYATNNIGTQYGNQVTIKTKDCSILTDPRDGQSYTAILYGTQCWMTQNLNYGTKILGVSEQTDNGIPEKYCFDNLDANCDVYGGLYQWAELVQYINGATNTTSWSPAPTGNIPGLCPAGWHVPKEGEWGTLASFLGGTGTAGGKMKEAGYVHWTAPNTGATNSSGFTALPGGYLWIDNVFRAMNTSCNFWTGTQTTSSDSYYRNMNYQSEELFQFQFYKRDGSSVRCVQD